jgi:hypothetical protein
MNKPKLVEKKIVKCKILPKFEKKFILWNILTNVMLYVRGNFKNVTIDLAIHSHSAPIFRLRCISIAWKKSYIYMKNLNT